MPVVFGFQKVHVDVGEDGSREHKVTERETEHHSLGEVPQVLPRQGDHHGHRSTETENRGNHLWYLEHIIFFSLFFII